MSGRHRPFGRFRGFVLSTIMLISVSQAVQARPITFAFEGIVSGVYDQQYLIYPQYVDYGSLISGAITFESDSPATPVDAWSVKYLNAASFLGGGVGALTFEDAPPPASEIYLVNDFPQHPSGPTTLEDWFYVTIATSLFDRPAEFSIGFEDYTGRALNSLALPELPPSFDGEILTGFSLSGGISIYGVITDMWVVPEPGALAMVMLVAAALLARRFRQGR